MNRASESAVDRLIALASDEKPAAQVHSIPHPPAAVETPERPHPERPQTTELEQVPAFADIKELEQNPMWKALLQFRVLVPYIARLLEVSTHSHTPAPAPVSNEFKQTVTDLQTSTRDLQTSQRDLRTVVQDQMVQMKRVEEDTARIRQAAEKSATQTAELTEDVKSVHSLLKIVGGVVGGLLLVLIVLVIYLLIKVH